MENLLIEAIESEAKKRLAKHSRDWYYIHKYRQTFTKRTGKKAKGGPSSVPKSWAHHNQFDPRYCINHSRFLAKGIWSALQAGTYQTVPSLRIDIPKSGGGFRTVDSFSVPDAAIAKIFLDNLRLRNAKIFSDSSYAYQRQKTPLDAVIRLNSALKLDVMFVSQYDFSSYFDSINHEYGFEPFMQRRSVLDYADGAKTPSGYIDSQIRGRPDATGQSDLRHSSGKQLVIVSGKCRGSSS